MYRKPTWSPIDAFALPAVLRSTKPSPLFALNDSLSPEKSEADTVENRHCACTSDIENQADNFEQKTLNSAETVSAKVDEMMAISPTEMINVTTKISIETTVQSAHQNLKVVSSTTMSSQIAGDLLQQHFELVKKCTVQSISNAGETSINHPAILDKETNRDNWQAQNLQVPVSVEAQQFPGSAILSSQDSALPNNDTMQSLPSTDLQTNHCSLLHDATTTPMHANSDGQPSQRVQISDIALSDKVRTPALSDSHCPSKPDDTTPPVLMSDLPRLPEIPQDSVSLSTLKPLKQNSMNSDECSIPNQSNQYRILTDNHASRQILSDQSTKKSSDELTYRPVQSPHKPQNQRLYKALTDNYAMPSSEILPIQNRSMKDALN